jgi:hypothetical protein
MTISRGQMNRQLYMGGGIMNARPRQQYGLGSFVKKAVKGVTGAVKDIASSDLGKAALVGAAAFGIPGTSMGGLFGRASLGGAAPGVFGLGGIGNLFGGSAVNKALLGSADYQGGPTSMFGGAKNFLSGLSKGQKIAGAIGGASILSGLLTKAQMEEIDEADPDERGDIVAEKLRQSLTRLGVSGQELEDRVAEGVSEYTGYTSKAEGGRIGYQDAGPVLPPDPTQPVNPFGPTAPPGAPVLPDRMMASNMENDKILEALFEKFLDMGLSPERAAEEAKKEFERMSMMQTEGRGLAAMGGRMNYALGDTASQNAMQAAGIEGLPIRQNPKGVKELDLRDNGGFIPPVGIKEKEDDIPAMLSNNEFVFTADAVRGMGDGDVELGAQRMYDQMKMLEKGGRV